MSMTVRRYSVVLGATAVATLLVATAAATLMLTGFRWFEDDSGAFAGSGWAIFIYLVRILFDSGHALCGNKDRAQRHHNHEEGGVRCFHRRRTRPSPISA